MVRDNDKTWERKHGKNVGRTQSERQRTRETVLRLASRETPFQVGWGRCEEDCDGYHRVREPCWGRIEEQKYRTVNKERHNRFLPVGVTA